MVGVMLLLFMSFGFAQLMWMIVSAGPLSAVIAATGSVVCAIASLYVRFQLGFILSLFAFCLIAAWRGSHFVLGARTMAESQDSKKRES